MDECRGSVRGNQQQTVAIAIFFLRRGGRSICGCIRSARIAGALADLRQLTAHVVKKFVKNRRIRAELFLAQAAKGRVHDSKRVGPGDAVAQITAEGDTLIFVGQTSRPVIVVVNHMT